MTALVPHPVRWQAPAPLWGGFGESVAVAAAAEDQARPAILRFAADDFMDRLLAIMARDPAQLGDALARPETWRTPPVSEPADLIERVHVPGAVRAASRSRALLRPRRTVPPVAAAADVVDGGMPRPALPLKLFQPAHQRYYLACASLVCGIAGMPDRSLPDGAATGFVLRRLLPPTPNGDPAALREFAFVKDAAGARWRRVTDGATDGVLVPGEETLSVFPLGFRDALDHRRILWTGLVPASRREEYMGAAVDRTTLGLSAGMLQSVVPAVPATPTASVQVRVTEFRRAVAEPWKNLVRAAAGLARSLGEPAPDKLSGNETQSARQGRVYAQNLAWQQASWLILLDFADYLAAQLPNVWTALQGGSVTLTAAEEVLAGWLAGAAQPAELVTSTGEPAKHDDGGPPAQPPLFWPNLGAALAGVVAARGGLEGTGLIYGPPTADAADWPAHHFLLAGVAEQPAGSNSFAAAGPYQGLPPQSASADVATDPVTMTGNAAQFDAANPERLIDRLAVMVARALPRSTEADQPAPPFALQVARAMADTRGDAGWFVLRFIAVSPDCLPFRMPLVSAPSQRFQLAHFFDPDAPARPVRITLPLDTTPAGLRKHSRNTAFVISDALCGQIQRAKALGLGDLVRSVLPWPFHKDLDLGNGDGACRDESGINIGMICSLSIPIVTICALILLIIIVTLFDFFFRWLPFFILCFPVPGLRAKRSGP